MKKHIVCFGDSNTHGYCADPRDSADRGCRYNENERWTCLLQKALGEDYLVIENGVSGRTTAFSDRFRDFICGLDDIGSALMAHRFVDLLIVMLGTNDTKERYGMNAQCIGFGLEKLCYTATTLDAWKDGKANILVIAPPHIPDEMEDATMGLGCQEKSRQLARVYEEICKKHGWAFLDADKLVKFNKVDYMHLTCEGHSALAEALARLVPELI